ncbi:MAG: sirohydrochlorin cobaltochelatase [Mailhella sp.]|nr:sirohydrochlorin cobaltochelatase [Mailhella sp.]
MRAGILLASLFVFSFFATPFPVFAKELTILAAFGTSDEEAAESLHALQSAYEKQGDTVIWAYSSNIIRAKLNKEKHVVYSVTEALDFAAENGYKDIKIQSLHVVPAEEYMKICRLISRYMESKGENFNSVTMGHPLLSSKQDLDKTIEAVFSALPKERAKEDALILMGHGNDRGTGDLSLLAAAYAFHSADPMVWLATVEGTLAFDNVLAELRQTKAKKVWLMPFMIVAGDHAKNDMAGEEEDSWKSMLMKNGYEVHAVLNGLGSIPKIQTLFIEHTANSHDNIKDGTIISR